MLIMKYVTPRSVWTVVIILSALTFSLAADLSHHPKDGNSLLQELWHTHTRLVPWWKRILTEKYGGQDITVENEIHKRSEPCPDSRPLSDGSVEVVSPGYQEGEDYPDDVVCSWTVSAPEGTRVQVHFVDLSVEYDATCDYDSLKIYNGDTTTSPVMGTFCGDNLPGADLVTSGNKVTIVFTTDGWGNDRGFKITCSTRDGATGSNRGSSTGAGDQCPSGSDVITTQNTELHSPGYTVDDPYPNDAHCTWKIRVPSGNRVKIHFLSFTVEQGPGCPYDSLQVYDGHAELSLTTELANLCGTDVPQDIISPQNEITIVFDTDDTETAAGFSLICEATNEESVGSSEESSTEDQFSSGSDESVGSGEESITEDQFSSGSDEYVGSGEQSSTEEQFSSGSDEYVGSSEESSTEDQCSSGSDVITTQNTDLHSPGYTVDDPYPNDAHCTWKIRVLSGKRVRIHFLSFTVEQGPGCSYDSLRIYDGHAELSSTTELANLCGTDVPHDIISRQNEITIVFDTDDTETAAGFFLTCEATAEAAVVPGAGDCPDGTNIITSPGTTIQSVGFLTDLPYLNDQDCVWRIMLDETLRVQLNVVEFSLEDSTKCSSDSVTVFDGFGSTQLGMYCGSSVPQTIQASANEMTIVFKSDGSDSHDGFQFQIVAITAEERGGSSVDPCSDNRPLVLSTPSVAVTTPGYAKGAYPNNQKCAWKINAPENQIIKLKTVRFKLEYGGRSCPYDHIQIFDGANAQSNQLVRLCGTSIPQDITSTDNNLYIVFTSDSSVVGEGFRATYTFEPEPVANTACDASSRPQVLSGSSGEFTSPGYGPGSNYADDKHCEWHISVPNGKKVKLHFDAFDLEYDSSCGYDKVEVYEGSSPSGTLQGSFCGDSNPADILSSGNNMFVKFTSDRSETRPGFKISYSTENGNRNCGVQDPQFLPLSGNTRIVGGVQAKPHSWPWQISLGYGSSSHFCGGSIISPNWVISASHCVDGKGPGTTLYVRVGLHNIFRNTANSAQHLVDRIIMHPQYTTNPANNDIALLHLRDAIEYNEHVKPVCLPNSRVPSNTRCLTTGWGRTQGTGNQRLLNQVYLPIVDQATCSRPDWYGSRITDVMVCAGYPEGRKDSCQGDSGGPLVCRQSGVYNLHGVTSWGKGCARAKKPGIYARMSEFVSWVQGQTGGAGQIS